LVRNNGVHRVIWTYLAEQEVRNALPIKGLARQKIATFPQMPLHQSPD
jgi:hypothetical protein